MAKVIYFTAGEKATAPELADIANLNVAAVAPYEVVVRRGDDVASYSYGAGIEAADYVAGTIPDAYSDTEDYPVIDPDDIPVPGVDYATQAIISNGDVLDTADGGTVTVAIVDGVATYTYAAGE